MAFLDALFTIIVIKSVIAGSMLLMLEHTSWVWLT